MKAIKILIVSILLFSINLIAANVATITALKGAATIQRGDTNIIAAVGSKLEQKDVIKTKDNSKLQIIFKDETIITLGKNSNFSIKEYLFEDSKEPVARFGMIKGAMKAITGKIGKIAPQKFTVKTKTASIGIRGTNFTIVLGEDGSFQAYCTYGIISVTINGEVYIVKQGFFITVSPIGEVEIIEFTPEDLKEMKEKKFGSNEKRVGLATKSVDIQKDENNKQLNLTVNENSSIIVQDVTDTVQDGVQETTQTLSQTLASYSMNNAVYTGTYSVASTTGYGTGLGTNGNAVLNIDFGADTANLNLNTGTAIFDKNPSFSGTGFTVEQNSNSGTADGTFQGPTGNSVIGNFFHDGGYFGTSSGTYDVSTGQNLH